MLDKAIEHGKEHRKPYYNAGQYDLTCRPNGGCPWCLGSRMHKVEVAKDVAADTLNDIDLLEDLEVLDRSFERYLDS